MSRNAYTPEEQANLAAKAYRKGNFEDAMKGYAGYMDSPLRMDAILGYGFSAIQAKRFEEAIAMLVPAGAEGRFQFRKLTALLAGYCFTGLDQQPEAVKHFERYTEEIVKGQDDVNPQDIDFSYRDLEDLDPMESDPDDDYDDHDDDEYEDDGPEPIRYSTYMRHYAAESIRVPGIVESWADYLDTEEKWRLPEQPDAWRIGNTLYVFAEEAGRRIALRKVGVKEKANNERFAQRLLDMAVAFRPDFAANAMYEKASKMKQKDPAAGIRMLRELISVYPEHTGALGDLSGVALLENDADLAVSLMERAAAVYEKYSWEKGTAEDDEKAVYYAAGIHYARTGNYAAGSRVLEKYLAMVLPELFESVTRPGSAPEDIWIALCQINQPTYYPYIVPTEIAKEALVFADAAIAVNNSANSHMARANTLLNNGRCEEAMENIRAGYAADPGNANVPYYHTCALTLMGAPVGEALDTLQRALDLDPSIMPKIKKEFKLFKLRANPAFKELYG